MDHAKVTACDAAAELIMRFGPGADSIEVTLYGVTKEAFDLSPGRIVEPTHAAYSSKLMDHSGVHTKIVLFSKDRES